MNRGLASRKRSVWASWEEDPAFSGASPGGNQKSSEPMVRSAILTASHGVVTAMSAIPFNLLATLPLPGRRSGSSKGAPRPSEARGNMTRAHLYAERTLDELSDEMLLSSYLEGNRRAFRDLVHRYRDELTHFLVRYLGSRPAAEDVFQETFLQVHLSADKFDRTRRFRPWLFTIAVNKARDYHRKHGKRQAVSLSASVDADDDGQRYADLLEADLPSPELPIVDAERSRMVKSVIDSLPAHLREILLLSYFQRMSYNQIAETLAIPLGTVKSRLHTAVASFARAWKATRVKEGEDYCS